MWNQRSFWKPGPQQLVCLTGLFPKQQRNHHPAELLTHPKESQWELGVMQMPETGRQEGWLIPTRPFFTLKAHPPGAETPWGLAH